MSNEQLLVISIIICLVIRVINRKKSQNNSARYAQQKITVEVTITDELVKEKLRTLYEEQDLCNQKIYNIQCRNKIIEGKIEDIKNQIKANDNYAKLQMKDQDCDVKLIQETYRACNDQCVVNKNELDAELLANKSKIIQLKKRSNKITEEVYKIGRDTYYGNA